MPNQNPYDPSGTNPFGRWDYSPWFWPPNEPMHGTIANPYYDPLNPTDPTNPPFIPGTPNPSAVGEAFMDTPVINGVAYPYLEVQPQAYRFRILNGADDRFWDLQWYIADNATTTFDGRTNTEV
jgi:FtsP/CotA-like multicopper oxidase with cupredoxin domain